MPSIRVAWQKQVNSLDELEASLVLRTYQFSIFNLKNYIFYLLSHSFMLSLRFLLPSFLNRSTSAIVQDKSPGWGLSRSLIIPCLCEISRFRIQR